MARNKSTRSAAVDRAAKEIGHALGTVAGRIDSLQARHPHPVDEARKALATGQETLAVVASKAGRGATAAIRTAKGAARKTKKAITQARRKRMPATTRAKLAAQDAMKRAKKVVKSGRRTVKRAVSRLKR